MADHFLYLLIPAAIGGFGFGYGLSSYQAGKFLKKIQIELNKLKKELNIDE